MESHKALFGAALTALLGACGPSKPTGSEYLGKWEADSIEWPGQYVCELDVAKTGGNFLITVTENGKPDSGGSICEGYRGIFTLTPEGNLKGSSFLPVQFFSDKENNRVGVSSSGPVTYLRRRSASNAAPPPRAAINLTIFSSTPSFIVGCSSTFSKSREDFLASRYVYADDLGAQSMISIAGRPLILKAVSKPDPAYFSQFADEEYTVSIKIGKTAPGQRGAETVEGTLTVQRKNGPTVTIAVYGERGC